MADVCVDTAQQLHLTLRDVRTAQYKITDFVYDAESKTFTG